MLEIIAAVNKAVNDFIWGVPAMVCIIGVGLLLSFRTRFCRSANSPMPCAPRQAHVPKKRCLGRFHDAVSGCMHGTGRHSGHGQHCRCGGRYCDRRPGRGILDVVFRTAWYVHKFAEVTLAVHFRERSKTGEWVGGPMYYIKNGSVGTGNFWRCCIRCSAR